MSTTDTMSAQGRWHLRDRPMLASRSIDRTKTYSGWHREQRPWRIERDEQASLAKVVNDSKMGERKENFDALERLIARQGLFIPRKVNISQRKPIHLQRLKRKGTDSTALQRSSIDSLLTALEFWAPFQALIMKADSFPKRS